MSRTMRLGLTGGIGSGKSLAGSFFQGLGIPVFDADRIARQFDDIILALFPAYTTEQGGLDRGRLRQHIFQNPAERERLEHKLHPRIIQQMEAMTEAHLTHPYVVWELPLLVEQPQLRDHVDRILLIDCSKATQIARVQKRNGWNLAHIQAILDSQASRIERVQGADDVILNEGSPAQLLHAISEKHRYYLSMISDSNDDKLPHEI